MDRITKGALMTVMVATALASAARIAAEPTAPARSRAGCIGREAAALHFSGILSVHQPQGEDVYAHGSIDGPASQQIDAATRFNLASAGKMFTSVAIAQLVDEGKLSLDDPIGHYLKRLRASTGMVTIRQLLTHSSGLGDFFVPANLAAIQAAHSVADLMKLVADDKPAFQPGSRFSYSSTGFLLLGRIIEVVSGQSYGDYLLGHIFMPVGMKDTGLDPMPDGNQATGVTGMPDAANNPGGPAGPLRPAPESAMRGNPAGGSYSSAADMQKFLSALMAGQLTSTAALRLFTSPQIVVRPQKDGAPMVEYGLGFGVGTFAGHRWFGHNGGAPGANTEIFAYPDDRTTVVVMSNRDPPAATLLFRTVRTIVLAHGPC